MNSKIGVIGYGYWGPNLVRNFFSIANCEVKTVVDLREERLIILRKNYPSIKITKNVADVFEDKTIDAVVIATPVFTHYRLAREALLHGKHVLVEKPIAASVDEASKLIDLSEKMKKVLMVDHTFLYTGAVQKIKLLIDKNEIGKVRYFDSTRINLGLFQSDVNVLWDLAPHDLSILNYLIAKKPLSVQAIGVSHLKNGIEDIAYLIIRYRSGLIAHLNCSWSSPIKIRLTLIGGDKKMIVYNDLETTEKVKIYDTGYSARSEEDKQRVMVDYRVGDIFVPKIEIGEALHEMAKDFIAAIVKHTIPISNSDLGLEVVKILELSQKSIKNKGKEIPFK